MKEARSILMKFSSNFFFTKTCFTRDIIRRDIGTGEFCPGGYFPDTDKTHCRSMDTCVRL